MGVQEKLVRDGLGGRIPADEIRIETDPEVLRRLLEAKLSEECAELAATRYSDVTEYADVFEVLLTLASRNGISEEDIAKARCRKRDERGGFDRGLVWSGGSAAAAPSSPAPRTASVAPRGVTVPPVGEVHVYADGACSGNPGPGGWAAVIISADGSVREVSGAERHTTNNRMELAAAAAGLRSAISDGVTRVVMKVDSTYVKDGIGGWIHAWKRKGWKTAAGEPVKNVDCWQALDAEVSAARTAGVGVSWMWVRGHDGHLGNEMADSAARAQVAAVRRR